jgi:hypothetical protein
MTEQELPVPDTVIWDVEVVSTNERHYLVRFGDWRLSSDGAVELAAILTGAANEAAMFMTDEARVELVRAEHGA